MPDHAPLKRPAAKRATTSEASASRAPGRDVAPGKPAPGPTFDIRTLAVHPPRAEPRPVQRVALPNRTGLPDRLKSGIEALSGLPMDDVRVHRNSAEPTKLGALAYAKGSAIHLAPGEERHLPHEAWHLVQQKQGRVRPTGRLNAGHQVNDEKNLEAEADAMGARAAALSIPNSAQLPTSPAGIGAERLAPKPSAPVQRVNSEDEEEEEKDNLPAPASAAAAASSSGPAMIGDDEEEEGSASGPELEERHAAPAQAGAEGAAASALPSMAESSSGPDRIFPNLSAVSASSEKHHYDNMHKNWEEQLKNDRFSFVKPGVEASHIGTINKYITNIKNPGRQPAPLAHAVTHETFLEPKPDRKNPDSNIRDPQSGEDKLDLRHEFTVNGNLYSTHLGSSQLYPVSGPDIFSGTTPQHMHNIVTANPGIRNSTKIKKQANALILKSSNKAGKK